MRSRCVRRLVKQCAEGQHLAEDGCGFGKRQRGLAHQRALCTGQHLMNAVAEFMGKRHHIPRLAHVVDQHIGVR